MIGAEEYHVFDLGSRNRYVVAGEIFFGVRHGFQTRIYPPAKLLLLPLFKAMDLFLLTISDQLNPNLHGLSATFEGNASRRIIRHSYAVSKN
jgi:hypothetical protein